MGYVLAPGFRAPTLPSPVIAEAAPTTKHLPPASTSVSASTLALSGGKEALAFQSLLKTWGISGESASASEDEPRTCQTANRHRLRCLSQTGKSWHQFRLFDLPAVLTLRDVDRREFHATVISATNERINLLIDGKPLQLSAQQLAFYWTGKFTLLWRLPTGFPVDGSLSQKSLNALLQSPPPWLFALLGADENAGARMRDLLVAFQQRSGLPANGVLGTQTLIALSRTESGVPRLQPPPTRTTR